jgi:hypothetical protein
VRDKKIRNDLAFNCRQRPAGKITVVKLALHTHLYGRVHGFHGIVKINKICTIGRAACNIVACKPLFAAAKSFVSHFPVINPVRAAVSDVHVTHPVRRFRDRRGMPLISAAPVTGVIHYALQLCVAGIGKTYPLFFRNWQP